MTITNIYKCDKCNNEQPSREQFWKVGISARHYGAPTYGGGCMEIIGEKFIDVCRPCLESFGIYTKTKPTEPSTPETIERHMRRIIELASS